MVKMCSKFILKRPPITDAAADGGRTFSKRVYCKRRCAMTMLLAVPFRPVAARLPRRINGWKTPHKVHWPDITKPNWFLRFRERIQIFFTVRTALKPATQTVGFTAKQERKLTVRKDPTRLSVSRSSKQPETMHTRSTLPKNNLLPSGCLEAHSDQEPTPRTFSGRSHTRLRGRVPPSCLTEARARASL